MKPGTRVPVISAPGTKIPERLQEFTRFYKNLQEFPKISRFRFFLRKLITRLFQVQSKVHFWARREKSLEPFSKFCKMHTPCEYLQEKQEFL